MPRILCLILLTLFALVLAAPAQADRGDKWHAWREHRGGGEQHGDHERAPHDRPPSDYPPSVNEHPSDNDRWRDRHDDDRPPGYDRREHDRARDGVIRGRMVPLEDLENRIARSTPGFRIGNPELLMNQGRPVYRMRWRTPDGHILIVFADAETGQVLDIRGR